MSFKSPSVANVLSELESVSVAPAYKKRVSFKIDLVARSGNIVRIKNATEQAKSYGITMQEVKDI